MNGRDPEEGEEVEAEEGIPSWIWFRMNPAGQGRGRKCWTFLFPAFSPASTVSAYRPPLMVQRGKNPPAMQEPSMRVWSLGGEEPLEEEVVTYSSILAWKIPWTEEPGGLQSKGSQRVRGYWAHTHSRAHACIHHPFSLKCIEYLPYARHWTEALLCNVSFIPDRNSMRQC